MRFCVVFATVYLTAASVALGDTIVWTETFDAGVGLLDQTRELGDIKFVWNGSTQQIDGEFERTGGGRLDRRFALLGQTLTHNDAFGFSMVVTPTAISPELAAPANLGFYNANQDPMTTWVGVRIGKPAGILISGTDDNGGPIGLGNNSPYIDFSFGQTYFITFIADGCGQLTMDVYLGMDETGTFLGATDWTLQPDEVFEVNALGMGNAGAGSTTFWASIDDVSYILPASSGTTILVPEDHATIQEAIDASCDGNEIIVAPGTYNEVINFIGKAITLHSSDGPEVTTIDGTGLNDSVVKCVSGEGPGTVLMGFTIAGGTGDPSVNAGSTVGGGMRIQDSSPRVENCVFYSNIAQGVAPLSGDGGGVYAQGGAPSFVRCIFQNNVAERSGGGATHRNGIATYVSCIFRANNAGDFGGGAYLANFFDVQFLNTAFFGNFAHLSDTGQGGGIGTQGDFSDLLTINCTFVANGPQAIWADHGGSLTVSNSVASGSLGGYEFRMNAEATVTYSNVQGGYPGTGNIDDDPLFIDAPNGNFRLATGSPCIDAADNTAVPPDIADLDDDGDTTERTPFDLDGNPRFVDDPNTDDCQQAPGTCGTPPIVDMGAYEFFPDCNGNDVPDDQDLDDCQGEAWCGDCNENSILDECDISAGTSQDCNSNGIPDECETILCDDNNACTSDYCVLGTGCMFEPIDCDDGDVCNGMETCDPVAGCQSGEPLVCDDGDICNGIESCDSIDGCQDGTPLVCDDGNVCNGIETCDPINGCQPGEIDDCNENEIDDSCDIAEGTSQDCQPNDIPDECDIIEGTSQDDDGNGVPDECESQPLLDIKPGTCPNPFNRGSNGVLPVALLGTADFEVTEVVLSTLLLLRADGAGEGVAPHEGPPGPHSTFGDAATPFYGETCECHEVEGDGIIDLLMKFRTEQLVEDLELDDLPGGAVVELVLTGDLLDGSSFSASDCIIIVPPGDLSRVNILVESNLNDTFVEVTPLDLNVDSDGFADFGRAYYVGTVLTATARDTVRGHTFARWIVDDVLRVYGMRTIDVIVTADTTLQAVYQLKAKYPMTQETVMPSSMVRTDERTFR